MNNRIPKTTSGTSHFEKFQLVVFQIMLHKSKFLITLVHLSIYAQKINTFLQSKIKRLNQMILFNSSMQHKIVPVYHLQDAEEMRQNNGTYFESQ